MKPTITITFNKFEDFKSVRDSIEESKLNPVWKYGGDANGAHYLQFFNGTPPQFYFQLGATMQKDNITGFQLS